jgi:hypothetical protein
MLGFKLESWFGIGQHQMPPDSGESRLSPGLKIKGIKY